MDGKLLERCLSFPHMAFPIGLFKTHEMAAAYPQKKLFKVETAVEETSSMTNIRNHKLFS